jgi:uncharacterized linocin/CFP29 family protein
MTDNCQVSWTDEQWARVNSVIQEEAGRARVAATFMPLVGPLPADTDFVREEHLQIQDPLTIEDRTTIRLNTLQVEVALRGSQMSDPDLTSALDLFRRAANGLARLEDAVVFNGITLLAGAGPAGAAGLAPPRGIAGLLGVWRIPNGEQSQGLWDVGLNQTIPVAANTGQELVTSVSNSIGQLEGGGRFGPFALVLDRLLFEIAQRPDANSLVLPQDRIIPFLGGGSLLRCSALSDRSGVIVALGGAPVELVVATDMSVQFLQMTLEPAFVFRVYEKIVLRIKEPGAICTLQL